MGEGSSRADKPRPPRARWRAGCRRRATTVAVILAGISASRAAPPSSRTEEYELKAAFVYKLAKFVEWPEVAGGDDSTLVIGVVGEDPFGAALDDAVNGKTVNGRSLVVRRFSAVKRLAPCRILFVSRSVSDHFPEVLEGVRRTPTLTIGEGELFTREGGIVGFVTEDDKVRFDINVDAAERAGLKISSKLLALAHVVHDREEGAR